jgi:ribosomal-protein-alanine N-acetyltransferase
MSAFSIRTLRHDDVHALLQFERANRAWFETYIEPRGDAFYSEQGVRAHIDEFLAAFAAGTRHPCVIVGAGGAIVGRVNLKDIDKPAGSAEVGYRIAASHAGQGLATDGVRHLVALARTVWQLDYLQAYVLPKNLASARVLEKCLFVRESEHDESAGILVIAFKLQL